MSNNYFIFFLFIPGIGFFDSVLRDPDIFFIFFLFFACVLLFFVVYLKQLIRTITKETNKMYDPTLNPNEVIFMLSLTGVFFLSGCAFLILLARDSK